jgi:hypothetical protein
MPTNHGLFRKKQPEGQPRTPEDAGVFRYGIRSVFDALCMGAFLPSNTDRMRANQLWFHFINLFPRFLFSLQRLDMLMRQMSESFSRDTMSSEGPSLSHLAGIQAEYAQGVLGLLLDDFAQAIVLATGLQNGTESMGRLKDQYPAPALAPVAPLLQELTGSNPTTSNPIAWWAQGFERREGVRQLLVHNHYLIQFGGVGPGDGSFAAQATLISPMEKIPLPSSDLFTLLRDILLSLCDWLDSLEVALKNHLAPKDPAYKWPGKCPLIMLPVGYPPGPTTLEADYFPLPMCAGSDQLPWTISWNTGGRSGSSEVEINVSIKTRIEDAEFLWSQGRKEGSWVQALIAAAATARKRYPKPIPDNQAFKSFICDIASIIVTGSTGGPSPAHFRFYSDNRGEHRTLEDIFYKELRCNLVHEAELKEIGFSESRLEGDHYEGTLSVPARGPAELPDFWVLHLIRAVKAAPENSDLFGRSN